jgi:hypothetical protein
MGVGVRLRRLPRFRLISKEQYQALGHEQKAWVRALDLHIDWRFAQDRHAPLDPGGETIVTVGHVQKLLRAIGVPRQGEKAAAEAIAWWQGFGLLRDTGKTKKPRINSSRLAAREKFSTRGGFRAERRPGRAALELALVRVARLRDRPLLSRSSSSA